MTSRWIYEIEPATDGNIERHKVRFVARGLSRIKGVDYEKSYVLGTLQDCYLTFLSDAN